MLENKKAKTVALHTLKVVTVVVLVMVVGLYMLDAVMVEMQVRSVVLPRWVWSQWWCWS